MSSSFNDALAKLRGRQPASSGPVRRPDNLPPAARPRAMKRVAERDEADMCDILGAWISARGFEVFYEVPLGGGRPDVVGIRGEHTLAIEAKLRDVAGVIKQGYRIVHTVDLPYVALPLETASEVAAIYSRIEREREEAGRPEPALPGVLVVGTSVRELRKPTGKPRRRIATEEVRRVAERFGAERGGVPNTDQTGRNIEIWRRKADGESNEELAERFAMSVGAVRNALRRLQIWRAHLAGCTGNPCLVDRPDDLDFFATAHKHAAAISALTDLS